MSTDQPDSEGFERLERIAARAQDDDAYRQQLLDDPATVLSDEGLTIPEGVNVVVHENTADEIHLVLPAGEELELEVEGDLRRLIRKMPF